MILPAQRALDKVGKGTLASGYLLLGREIYWRDRVWAALRRATGLDASSTTGLEEFDLRRNSLDEVVGRARERNLWIPRQLLLVRNANALSGVKALESLSEYFRDPSPDSVLVFEMTDVDLETDDWREKEKIKSRQENWADLCEVVLLAPPSMAESLELVRREAAERGKKISPPAAENLVAMLDRDFGRIVKEIEKLCVYSGAEEISADDVSLLTGSRGAPQHLSLPEAIGTGDLAKVLEAFDESVPRGAYLPLVLADIARHLRQVLLLQQAKVRDPREASRMLWSARLPAPQTVLPELLRQARAVPQERLVRCFQRAFDTDLSLRSSPTDERMVVERYLVDLAISFRATSPALKAL